MPNITSCNSVFFSNFTSSIFHNLYTDLIDDFKCGRILLVGSYYYHLMGMRIYRIPNDLDLTINEKYVEIEKRITNSLLKIDGGIVRAEQRTPKYAKIGIYRTITHKSGVKIEITRAALDNIYHNPVNAYDLFHLPIDLILNDLFRYFDIYIKRYNYFKNCKATSKVETFLFKMEKMYSNIIMIAEHYNICLEILYCNYRSYLDEIYSIFNYEGITHFNLHSYFKYH